MSTIANNNDDMKPSNHRIEYLDSMRGIAALMVLIYHFIGWKWADQTNFHLASFIFNGSDAVSFFFVLSGFVLSYKYFHSTSQLNISNYIKKRILRLYPAYIIAVILNYFYWKSDSILDLNLIPVFNDIFLDKQGIWKEFLMVQNNHRFYFPGWTLGVEMALSLLMPFLIISGKTNIRYLWWFLPISFIMESYLTKFSFHFALGALLSYYYPKIISYDWKNWAYFKYRYIILLTVFILFSIRQIEKMFPFGRAYDQITFYLNIDLYHITGLASALIILWVLINKKAQKLLSNPVFMFLGKISYGIYLFHWMFIVYVMDHWDQLISYFPNFNVGFITLLLLVLLFTCITATIGFYCIEKPFMKLGKRKTSDNDN